MFCNEVLNKRDLCSLRETAGSVTILRTVHVRCSNSWQLCVCVTDTANQLHFWNSPAPPLLQNNISRYG